MNKILLGIGIIATVLLSVACSNNEEVEKANQLRLEGKLDEAAELYTKAAEDGNAYAMWCLWRAYNNGEGVEFNPQKGMEWLQKAAENDCEEAQMDLARSYLYGWDVPVDSIKAKKMINKLVESSKNPYVIVRYACFYWDGEEGFIEKNRDKALEILESITDKEHPEYLFIMGYVYYYGKESNDADDIKGIEYWEKAFNKGRISAAVQISDAYLDGSANIKPDIDKKVEWLKKGMNYNSAVCMRGLGYIYLSEDSVFVKYHNPEQGLTLLRKAVKFGDARACNLLGWRYESGSNVNVDYKEAFEMYKKADEYGSGEGSYNLGRCYMSGIGCEKDFDKAEECFIRAADREYPDAAFWLAQFYETGVFDFSNIEKFNKYNELGAKLGHKDCQFQLAINYYYGYNNYPVDYFKSFEYAKKAADQDMKPAIEHIVMCYENGTGCAKDLQKAQEYREKLKGL